MFCALLIATILLSCKCFSSQLNHLELQSDPGAICLDGSPHPYYIREGRPAAEKRRGWRIQFEGGGWCFDDNSCLTRASSHLGSSNGDVHSKYNFMNFVGGLMDAESNKNPLFYNYTAVFVRYCDGAAYGGDMIHIVKNGTRGNVTLHSAGRQIIKSLLMQLRKKHGLAEAEEVIIGGCSAGGAAVYHHLDWMSDWLQKNTDIGKSIRVVGLPDAGWFIQDLVLPVVKSQNVTGKMVAWSRSIKSWRNDTFGMLNADCVVHYEPLGEAYKCAIAQFAFPFIQSKMFILQSLTDTNQLAAVPLAHCLRIRPFSPSNCNTSAISGINTYADQLYASLSQNALSDPKTGIWAPRCLDHCLGGDVMQEDSPRLPWTVSSKSAYDAFAQWWIGKQAQLIDKELKFPNNPSCEFTCAHC